MAKKEEADENSNWLVDDSETDSKPILKPTLYQKYIAEIISRARIQFNQAGSAEKIFLFLYYISIGWILMILSIPIHILLDFNNFITTLPITLFSRQTTDYSK